MSSVSDGASARRADLPALTGVRAFAALAVLAYHFTEGAPLPDWFSPLVRRGYLGVDLFFILSGFIIHHCYRDHFAGGAEPGRAVDFIVRRFARIWPMHMASMLAMLALYAAALAIGRPPADAAPFAPAAVLSSVLMIHAWIGLPSPNIPAWSISAEWFAYLLYPFICAPVVALGARARVAAIIACLIAVELGANLHPLLRIAPEFLFGMMLYDLKDRLPVWRGAGFAAAAAIIAALYAIPGEALALRVLLFGVLIVALSRTDDRLAAAAMAHPAAMRLGEMSCSIYLLHGVVWAATKNIARLLPGPPVDSPIVILAATAATLGASAAAYAWLEKPARAAIHQAYADGFRRGRAPPERGRRSGGGGLPESPMRP